MGAHTGDLDKVARGVNPQHLDRDVAALVFTLPHVAKPAAIQRGIRSIVAKWDLQRFRKQSMASAHPTQAAQTLPPEAWWEIQYVQSLIGEMREFESRGNEEDGIDQPAPRRRRSAGRTSCTTSMNDWAASLPRLPIILTSSFFVKISSIREGSSCGEKTRLIKRLQAESSRSSSKEVAAVVSIPGAGGGDPTGPCIGVSNLLGWIGGVGKPATDESSSSVEVSGDVRLEVLGSLLYGIRTGVAGDEDLLFRVGELATDESSSVEVSGDVSLEVLGSPLYGMRTGVSGDEDLLFRFSTYGMRAGV